MLKKKILVTGGGGRFAKVLKNKHQNLNLYFASKKECNILNEKSILKTIKKIKPNIVLHTAALFIFQLVMSTKEQKTIIQKIVL